MGNPFDVIWLLIESYLTDSFGGCPSNKDRTISSYNEEFYRQSHLEQVKSLLLCLTLNVTANSVCEIHCLALDGFDLNAVHKLIVKRKISAELGFEPGAAEWEARMLHLCYTAPQN